MKTIIDHIPTLQDPAVYDPTKDALQIAGVGEADAGGALSEYQIEPIGVTLAFQNGTVPEAGLNGMTNEALIAVLIDRLRGYQVGPVPSLENEHALAYLLAAMQCLHNRTAIRVDRGVAGTVTA